jgi:ACS family allantoate permease-like MFS transporter
MWGLVLCCLAAVKSFSGAIAVRFFLGVFEAAVTPGFALFTSQVGLDNTSRPEQDLLMLDSGIPRRSKAREWVSGSASMASHRSSEAWLPTVLREGRLHGSSIAPWKIVFLVTGVLTAVIGCIFLFVMPDNQLNARWLSKDDRLLAVERVRVNQQGIGNKHFKLYQLKEALLTH